MITMALVSILGLMALTVVTAVFLAVRSGRLASTAASVDREVGEALRRADDTDAAFADALESGIPLDRALEDYHRARAAIITIPGRTAAAWNWDKTDLAAWRAGELSRRGDAVNRRLLVPALTSALLVVALTVTVVSVQYSFFSAEAVENAPVAKDTPTQASNALPSSPVAPKVLPDTLTLDGFALPPPSAPPAEDSE